MNNLNSAAAPSHSAEAAPLEVLVFAIGSEHYGVPIGRVRELRGHDAVTGMANAPAFLTGVINLRGTIIPIVDMRIKLGLAAPDHGALTVVVIVDLAGGQAGMVVDSVADVVALPRDNIKPAPALGATGASFVTGVGTLDERMLILVDIDAMIGLDAPAAPALLAA